MIMTKKTTYILAILGVPCAAVLLFAIWVNMHILSYGVHIVPASHIHTSSTMLIFGGGMERDGSMSVAQRERVNMAISLYEQGRVSRMIFTGDDGARRFNEVDAMAAHAIAHDVSEDVIEIDRHGYNTYTSCYRAAHEKDLKRLVVISQEFHLRRIIYFCNRFGIDTRGVAADLGKQGIKGVVWSTNIREKLARVKGWFQMEITKPGPLMFYK